MTDPTGGREGRRFSDEELQDLVASTDSGARDPLNRNVALLISGLALLWSLFQLWIAQPQLWFGQYLPVLNSSQTRPIHLTFALLLAFMAYPALKSSPRHHIPVVDWMLALAAGGTAFYVFWFSDTLAMTARSGLPTQSQVIVGAVGLVCLLEASRRALGPALTIVGSLFALYGYMGQGWLIPDLIAHEGLSFTGLMNALWLDTAGVFGIPLGVSTAFVFLFVLFGSLLDKAGAGNYFIKLAFAGLGHLRGGPAKAAVVGSAMTGLISGSSIANVVTTGTFTIPLMKRVGFTSEQAGSVEVASSVNGQIMPPVMGAAAFLMVEFIGISYLEVIKHAFIPGGDQLHRADLHRPPRSAEKGHAGAGRGEKLYRHAGQVLHRLRGRRGRVHGADLRGRRSQGRRPGADRAGDDGGAGRGLPVACRHCRAAPRSRSGRPQRERDQAAHGGRGLCDRAALRPAHRGAGLVPDGGTPEPGEIGLLRHVADAVHHRHAAPAEGTVPGAGRAAAGRFIGGLEDLIDGLIAGARNMIGIGVATAAAGIIVAIVTKTPIGTELAGLVEQLSGGILILMLVFVGLFSLILGMGLPTTANYIVVSSLMASVVVTLGAQEGLIVPLIAAHLFVFYFGIMADVTPPVGLASFAAAAVSGGDPIRTGFTAFFYSLRTVALPFLFIFNPTLILYGVDLGTWAGIGQAVFIFVIATFAMLLFAAATQGYFLAKSRLYESAALLLVAFTLFVPNVWLDMVQPPFRDVPPAGFEEAVADADEGDRLRLSIEGPDFSTGDMASTTLVMPIEGAGSAAERIDASGLLLIPEGDVVRLDEPMFGTDTAERLSDFDFYADTPVQLSAVQVPVNQMPAQIFFIPALLLLGLIVLLQRRRQTKPAF